MSFFFFILVLPVSGPNFRVKFVHSMQLLVVSGMKSVWNQIKISFNHKWFFIRVSLFGAGANAADVLYFHFGASQIAGIYALRVFFFY